jgi:antitoxin component YwqK of YwqJK toxin-antitoxin module
LLFSNFLKEAILKPISKRTITGRRMVDQNQKVDYWFYYYENGNKKRRSHYQDNKNANGGFFMNQIRKLIKKNEFENDQLNGFSLFQKKTNN